MRLSVMMALLLSFAVHSATTSVPMDLFRTYLPSNPTVVEAGAQFGEDTVKLSDMWPNGKIFAFEPSPASYASLAQAALQKTNIFSFQLALSNAKGEMPFYLAGGASSLLQPTAGFNEAYFHADIEHPLVVNVTTLDDWLDERGVSQVDFLWFDMEGNELNALQGALRHLSNVTLIYTEVNLQEFWHGTAKYDTLKAWLEARGFVEVWSEVAPFWQGNALFLNQNRSAP